MRKHDLLATMLLLTLSQAFSQSNIFPQNGNVGIGTTNPTNTLTVNGTIEGANGIKLMPFNCCGPGLPMLPVGVNGSQMRMPVISLTGTRVENCYSVILVVTQLWLYLMITLV